MTHNLTTDLPKRFSYEGPHESDIPRDYIDAAFEAVKTLELIFEAADHVEINGSHALGLCRWTNGIACTLRYAGRLVEEQIHEPFTAGYRKGSATADAEYNRGFAEGRAAAMREAARNDGDRVA